MDLEHNLLATDLPGLITDLNPITSRIILRSRIKGEGSLSGIAQGLIILEPLIVQRWGAGHGD